MPRRSGWRVLALSALSVLALAADVVIDNTTISTTQINPATPYNTVQLGGTSLTVTPSAVLTVAAQQAVSIEPGTVIQAGATVDIRINQPPTATPQSVTTPENTAVPVVLAGTDPEGATLTYALATQPTKGVLSGTAPNLTYTPNSNATGNDSFTFTVNDGIWSSSAATVAMTITAVNQPPSITAIPNVTLFAGLTQAVPVVVADPDTPLGSLTVTAHSLNQTLLPDSALIPGGSGAQRSLSMTPVSGQTGTASITVTVSDGALTGTATFTATVQAWPAAWTTVDQDVVTSYTYYSGGQINTMTASNRVGATVTSQVTTYTYASPYSKALPTTVAYPDSTGAGDVVTTAYDRLGRKTTLTDQRTVSHTYAYDTAGRLQSDAATYPAAMLSSFDTTIAPIPAAIGWTYDRLSRPATLTTTALNTAATIAQITWTYDGRGQVITSAQNHGETAQSITYNYTSTANGTELRYQRLTSIGYPDGSTGSGPTFVYPDPVADPIGDALVRVQRMTLGGNAGDGTPSNVLAEYTYLGHADVVARQTRVHSYAAGSTTSSVLAWDISNGRTYTGLDTFGRVIRQDWTLDGTTIEGSHGSFDRVSNLIYRAQDWTTPWQAEEAFAYDRVDRLVKAERGVNLAPGATGRSTSWQQTWGFDSLGNWAGFLHWDQADATANVVQTRVHNAANEIDVDNNDANPAGTAIATQVGTVAAQPLYDAAGNMTAAPRPCSPGTRQYYVYDAWNQLAVVRADSTTAPGTPGAVVAAYVYDGQHRRTEIRIAPCTTYPTGITLDSYYSESWQELVQFIRRYAPTAQNNPGTVLNLRPEEYYWDASDPNVLLGQTMFRDAAGVPLASNPGGTGGAGRVKIIGLRFAYDSSHNVTATVGVAYNDPAQQPPMPMKVIERQRYTPYGVSCLYQVVNFDDFTTTGGALQAESVAFSRWGFGEGQTDRWSGLICMRNRYYDPNLGRFVNRDPAEYGDGMNWYMYVHGNPASNVDPLGLYDVGGHYYTTYIVALACGYPREMAIHLAYYSQMPDQYKSTDACGTGYWTAIKAIFRNEEARDVQKGQHFLQMRNEAEIRKARFLLKSNLALLRFAGSKTGESSGEVGMREMGMLIHLFGDSYAHTEMKDGHEVGFNTGMGHGWEGSRPDMITLNAFTRGKYMDYIDSLASALGETSGPNGVKMLNDYKDFIGGLHATSIEDENSKIGDYFRKKSGLMDSSAYDPTMQKGLLRPGSKDPQAPWGVIGPPDEAELQRQYKNWEKYLR